jgi:hypothetical protein
MEVGIFTLCLERQDVKLARDDGRKDQQLILVKKMTEKINS